MMILLYRITGSAMPIKNSIKSCFPGIASCHGETLEEFKRNLRGILEEFKRNLRGIYPR
jgi:hypothetical protein